MLEELEKTVKLCKQDEYSGLIDDLKKTAYSYYSNILKRPFDSIDELKTAEAEHQKKLAEKREAANTRKTDATKVEEAFKRRNKINKECTAKKKELYDEYHKTLATLTAKLKEDLQTESSKIKTANADYTRALSEFTKKYPEGYHLTLKDGDVTEEYSSNIDADSSVVNCLTLDELFDELFSDVSSFWARRK